MRSLRPVIKYQEMLIFLKQRKTLNFYYYARKRKQCFSGNLRQDIKMANELICSDKSDALGHALASMFRISFDLFYGDDFNHKWIRSRPYGISKFTSRLDKHQIQYVKERFRDWINEKPINVLVNKHKALSYSRSRIFHCFKALLFSGMRVGELCSIDFKDTNYHRIIKNRFLDIETVEIVINTEKTCKKREVYLPLDSFNFFRNDNRKLNRNLVGIGFLSFREWSKLPFMLSAHTCRRTLATIMYESGVDVFSIAMVLGNTPKVVMNHYIISSYRNFAACEIAHAFMDGSIKQKNNMFFNPTWMQLCA